MNQKELKTLMRLNRHAIGDSRETRVKSIKRKRTFGDKNADWVLLIAGMLTVLTGYIAWGTFTISYKAALYREIGFWISIATMIFYCGLCLLTVRLDRKEVTVQFVGISGTGCGVFFFLAASNTKYMMMHEPPKEIAILFLWTGILLFCYCFLRYKVGSKLALLNVKAAFLKYKWLILLLLITVLFMIEPQAMQFKWDGLLYYLTCSDLNLESLSSLAVYGHIAQAYGVLNGVFDVIIGNTAIAMTVVNCMVMIISICAFYGILKIVIVGEAEWVCVLFTAVYAWSPFLLGMVHYHNLDFLCQCLYPGVLYCLYKRKWAYFCVASFLFCFTKEPAVIIYGATCAGVVILEWFLDQDYSFMKRIGRVFVRKQYYLMAFPGGFWFITYKIIGPWSAGEGSFAIDWNYVLEKLKVLYIFNFNWIFSIVVVGGLVFLGLRRKEKEVLFIVPIMCAQIAFTVFSCLFKTVNHPRYTDTSQVAMYSMAIVLLYCMNRFVCRIFYAVVSGLMLVSTYLTIDPITKICFPMYDIGTTMMVTTMEYDTPLGDGMIYNRQMLGLEKVMNMALEDALSDSDVILFPTLENNTYFFDGMAEVGSIKDNYRLDIEYWNSKQGRREPAKYDGIQKFYVYHLVDNPDWGVLEDEINGEVNLIYLSFAGEQYVEGIRENYEIIGEEAYEYHGWRLNRICFKINDSFSVS